MAYGEMDPLIAMIALPTASTPIAMMMPVDTNPISAILVARPFALGSGGLKSP